MGNTLTINTDPTPPAEPTVDHESAAFDLDRHATLARQLPGYVGSALHASIRERLSKNGVTIK